MMNCIDTEIDELKRKLNSLIINYPLTDKKVIYYSQKLDKLIVKYEESRYYPANRKRAV